MRVKPVLTEKSIADAREGKYTFWVWRGWNKREIGRAIGEAFGVSVKTVKTMNYKVEQKRDQRRRKNYMLKPKKKAVVTLKQGEKIDLFGEEDKKKK